MWKQKEQKQIEKDTIQRKELRYGYLIPSDWNYEKMNQTKSKSESAGHGWKLIVRHWSITCVCSNGCCQIRVSLCRQ